MPPLDCFSASVTPELTLCGEHGEAIFTFRGPKWPSMNQKTETHILNFRLFTLRICPFNISALWIACLCISKPEWGIYTVQFIASIETFYQTWIQEVVLQTQYIHCAPQLASHPAGSAAALGYLAAEILWTWQPCSDEWDAWCTTLCTNVRPFIWSTS